MSDPFEKEEVLHEIRREWQAGEPARPVFATPWGSLEAQPADEGFLVRRRLGRVGAPVLLSWVDLRLLAAVFEVWRERREEWAAFYRRGLPPFQVEIHLYHPPGRGSRRRVLARLPQGEGDPGEGHPLVGFDEARDPGPPLLLRPGLTLVANLWRREPFLEEPEGQQVGERWRFATGPTLDLRRYGGTLFLGERFLDWAAAEDWVPRALLAVRGR